MKDNVLDKASSKEALFKFYSLFISKINDKNKIL